MNSVMTQKARAGQYLLSTVGALSADLVHLAPGPALPSGQVLSFDDKTQLYSAYVAPAEGSKSVVKAAAILYAPAGEREAPLQVTVTSRLAEVSAEEMSGLDALVTAQLAERFIIVR